MKKFIPFISENAKLLQKTKHIYMYMPQSYGVEVCQKSCK